MNPCVSQEPCANDAPEPTDENGPAAPEASTCHFALAPYEGAILAAAPNAILYAY